MLINLSNHPSSEWTEQQSEEARKRYGEITDIPFPQVPPDCNETDLIRMAEHTVDHCMKLIRERNEPAAIHIMGEMTLNYVLVRLFQQKGLECIASVTERKYKLNGTGFLFMGFRKYPVI